MNRYDHSADHASPQQANSRKQRDVRQSHRTPNDVDANEDQYTEDLIEDDDEAVVWPSSIARSAIRYTDTTGQAIGTHRHLVVHRASIPRRASARAEQDMEERALAHSHRRSLHWLVFVGLVLLILLLGYMLLTNLFAWWQITQDDWHYGRPRTYQADAVVGHQDSIQHPSHFIAINLNGQIEVIEFPGGDAARAKVYIGPSLIGTSADLMVVTLAFADVNGDGMLDLIIDVQGGHFIFLNNGKQFRPVMANDHVSLPS